MSTNLEQREKHTVFKWSSVWYGCCGICTDCLACYTSEGGQATAMLRLERHVRDQHHLSVDTGGGLS